MEAIALARPLLGVALLAILPGWVWSRLILPRLDRVERFTFSVVFSLALMVLALYLGSVAFRIRIDATHAILWALAITAAGWAAAAWLRPDVEATLPRSRS